MSLTAKGVERLRLQPGRYRDGAGREGVAGLILQVISPTRASWVLRYERHGRERWLGLGPLKLLSLSQARERARAARRQLLDGVDPVDSKKAAKAARVLAEARNITFETAARRYHDQHKSKWRNAKKSTQFLSVLETYAFPIIGKLAVADVDTSHVLRVLEQKNKKYPDQRLWDAIPETSQRMRSMIDRVLDWALVRGYRTGDNPARWAGYLSEVLPPLKKQKHHAALPYSEVAEFITQLRKREGISPAALEFCILTAARTGEVVGATWAEIDLKNKVWTVPANRMKAGREHRVPLSARAVGILQSLPKEEGNEFVFIGSRHGGMSKMTLDAVLHRMGVKDRATVHGFRSTFMDWAHENTAFPKVVIDMALAHTVGDRVEAAYRRGDLFDKRRKLMEAWATHCTTPAASSAKLLPLRGR
jgi:integrase